MNETQQSLFEYLLWLGDTSLILGHRNSEWCGHGPILEEDIALTNIALDLIGQARMLLTYASETEGKNRSEDDLAYLRDVLAYRNSLLAEQPNGDFGNTMMRQLLFTVFSFHLQTALQQSADEKLRAIAAKAIKETTYHLRHASDWIIRLGDGTEESHKRVQDALNNLWMFTGDLFVAMPGDKLLLDQKTIPDISIIKSLWKENLNQIFTEATLTMPTSTYQLTGGRAGRHGEHLGFILAELQFMPRAYPGAKW